GNGNGTCQSPVKYAAGGGSSHVEGADLNGDGKADLAISNLSGLVVLFGIGDGSFSSPVTFSPGTPFGSVVAADFNGDGRVDLAAAYQGVYVLLSKSGA